MGDSWPQTNLEAPLFGSVAAKVLHDVGAAVWTGTGSVFGGHTPRIPYISVLCALPVGGKDEGW